MCMSMNHMTGISNTARYLIPLAVLALFATACGDDPDSSGPRVLVVSEDVNATRSAAPAAMEGAGLSDGLLVGDSKMMPYYQTHLVATVDLPALDSDAPAYEVRSTDLDLEKLKGAFGLTSDFTEVAPDMGGGWTAGPNDGTAPSMSVYTWAGMSNWSYSPAWSDTMTISVDCGVAVSNGTDGMTDSTDVATTVVDMGECPTPEPPANVPTKSEAETKFTEVMNKIGVDQSNLVLETYADEWSANVTGYLVIDGVRSQLTYSVGFGGEGAIQWASGFIGEVVKIDDYPRIGTSAALEVLNDQMSYAYPRVMDDVVIEPAVGDTVAVAPVAPDTAVPETVAPDTTPVDTTPAMIVEDVNIVGVEEELQLIYGDEITYLVPGYAFIGEAADQYTPRYTVIAIPDQYIEQAIPTPDTAVAVPLSEAPVAVESGSAGASSAGSTIDAGVLLVGKTEDEATVIAKQNGLEVRVVERDGEMYPGTMDYRTDRVNIKIANGKITAANIG